MPFTIAYEKADGNSVRDINCSLQSLHACTRALSVMYTYM